MVAKIPETYRDYGKISSSLILIDCGRKSDS